MLDDYQVITAPPVQRLVAALIEHLPPSFHLVIATRAEPPLPIAQLRARGQVHELRADQLRFDTGEAAAFLTEVMGPALTEAASATLAARTEGWIAGLQLAALALRDQPDPALFVRDFEGSHRYVLDYLMAEVLDRQPAHIQTFLSRTAVLERLCGPLCDAVLGLTTDGGEAAPDDPTANSAGASPSQRLLEQLERADLFLIPLDDEWVWYRYHHLFADALRHRLRSRQPTWATEAHRRASAWYAGQGLLVEAVRHALAANATEQAADLIERASLTLLQRSELPMLRAWLEALPASVVRSRPWLGLRYAWLPRFNGQLEASAA